MQTTDLAGYREFVRVKYQRINNDDLKHNLDSVEVKFDIDPRLEIVYTCKYCSSWTSVYNDFTSAINDWKIIHVADCSVYKHTLYQEYCQATINVVDDLVSNLKRTINKLETMSRDFKRQRPTYFST